MNNALNYFNMILIEIIAGLIVFGLIKTKSP